MSRVEVVGSRLDQTAYIAESITLPEAGRSQHAEISGHLSGLQPSTHFQANGPEQAGSQQAICQLPWVRLPTAANQQTTASQLKAFCLRDAAAAAHPQVGLVHSCSEEGYLLSTASVVHLMLATHRLAQTLDDTYITALLFFLQDTGHGWGSLWPAAEAKDCIPWWGGRGLLGISPGSLP